MILFRFLYLPQITTLTGCCIDRTGILVRRILIHNDNKINPPSLEGWSGGAKVLGKLPVPGRPTILITVGQGPTALAVGAGGGCLDIFTLIYPFSSLSPSLFETARYRLKYCLKGPLNPKQPTNQPFIFGKSKDL